MKIPGTGTTNNLKPKKIFIAGYFSSLRRWLQLILKQPLLYQLIAQAVYMMERYEKNHAVENLQFLASLSNMTIYNKCVLTTKQKKRVFVQ